MNPRIHCLALFACLSAALSAGEVRDLFEKQQAGAPAAARRGILLNDPAQPKDQNHGITQIGIEHTPCFGHCPVFTFVVNSDGSFRYVSAREGRSLTPEFGGKPREGSFTGKIDAREFHNLARYMKEAGFMELADRYDGNFTDAPTAYTMVVMNGTRKIVSNYGGVGPAKLWAMEKLIDRLLDIATWDEPAATSNGKQ